MIIARVVSDIDYSNDEQMANFPADPESMRRIDVEEFIFSLSLNETIVLLFMAMAYKPKEICPLLGYKNVNNVYQILGKMRTGRVLKEEF